MQGRPIITETEENLGEGVRRIDIVPQAIEELFYIENPHVRKNSPDAASLLETYQKSKDVGSVYVYYPWLNLSIRMPQEEVYFRLRTIRNRNLISESEQALFRAASVGIAGLSVGSTALSSLVQTGGPKRITIADPDTIDITNLNRIRATLAQVGQNKTTVTAQSAWELDPFLDLTLYESGIHKDTLEEFLGGASPLDVCIDEMDDIALKIAIRRACKVARIPVVMATDNGDSTILDVERFDLEPTLEIFHGRINISDDELQDMNREKFVRLANRIIDPSFFTDRQQQSLMEIGKTLSGVPQLATAASVAGAAVAYAVRRIVTKQDMPSGRYVISLEEALISGYMEPDQKESRKKMTETFNAAFT